MFLCLNLHLTLMIFYLPRHLICSSDVQTSLKWHSRLELALMKYSLKMSEKTFALFTIFTVCLLLCVSVFCFPSGVSRGGARPATCHQGPFSLFTRAATALVLISSTTAGSALTLAAAHLTKPALLRWPSSAPLAECYSELWWWSTLVSVTTTAPTHHSVTLHCGATGPDQSG